MNYQSRRRLREEDRIARLLRLASAPLRLDQVAAYAGVSPAIARRRLQALEASGQAWQSTVWQAKDVTETALAEAGAQLRGEDAGSR